MLWAEISTWLSIPFANEVDDKPTKQIKNKMNKLIIVLDKLISRLRIIVIRPQGGIELLFPAIHRHLLVSKQQRKQVPILIDLTPPLHQRQRRLQSLPIPRLRPRAPHSLVWQFAAKKRQQLEPLRTIAAVSIKANASVSCGSMQKIQPPEGLK